MPKLDINAAPRRTGSGYPEPYAGQMAGRSSQRLGALAGLTQFGVNLITLEPGAKASLRHWHLREDEFAVVLSGELVLVEDGGEVAMAPGDCAAWKAGVADAHHLVNRSGRTASFIVVGTSVDTDVVTYGDVDMKIVRRPGDTPRFTHHDGSDWSGPRDLAPKGDTE